MNTIKLTTSLDPDQSHRLVGPGMGPKLFAIAIIRWQWQAKG